MHGIAAQQAALTELLEFDPLDLQLLEALTEHDLSAIHVVRIGLDLLGVIAFRRILERVTGLVALRYNSDATG